MPNKQQSTKPSTNRLPVAPTKIGKNIHATMAKVATSLSKKVGTKRTIKTKAEYEANAALLVQIKSAQKDLAKGKAEEVGPIESGLNKVKERWAGWAATLASAETIVKEGIAAYFTKQEAKQEKLTEKFQSGAIKSFTTYATKSEAVVKGGSGVSGRDKPVYTVVDEKKIPREYLVPDMGLIKEAFTAGKKVPGVKVTYQKVISARS